MHNYGTPLELTKIGCLKASQIIKQFLLQIDHSIKSEKQQTKQSISEMLQRINKLAIETPLSTRPQRFANEAIADFHTSLSVQKWMHNDVLDRYLLASFGNPCRMDYGTGHELNFLCFLYCLVEEEIMEINEVYETLKEYFNIIRVLILRFNLEPAGSHGQWGIDDYQILPYVLGAAELVGTDITWDQMLKMESNGYAQAVRFAAQHRAQNNAGGYSPMVLALKTRTWDCINNGLIRMYESEVLDRGVVMQHFIFSKYLPRDY
ncbi:Serine/threonine-protein phosphatase 2A activator [Astathelohania contejeani]|uniref:Serine/threonine-protein phosphatase 2A activator n=1 Tax=Astathelohania contejeani TaxID=164912 RepID=A0ABQ7HX12_9MICR|nr:Serine/threonine-protein phosphatase 2A activator [Thelohania contejeani]